MIDVYYWPTPNGKKITIFLEETGLDYKIIPVNIRKGEQFQPDFLRSARTTGCPPSLTTTDREENPTLSSNQARS